jgi:Flp pilus assembly protein TadG
VTASSRRSRRTKAQALVEFALVAPIFFLILFGIVEAGRFIFHYQLLSNATRDGARYAIVHGASTLDPPASGPGSADPSGANVKAVVLESAIAIADDGNLTVTVVWPLSNERGDPVTVSVAYQYDPIVPLLPSINVTAESTLVINN